MPDIPVGAQVFDLTFHPDQPLVLAGLLTGHIKSFAYDEQGNYEEKFSVRPSKKSCRTLAFSADGAQVWAAGKAKGIQYVLFTLLSGYTRSLDGKLTGRGRRSIWQYNRCRDGRGCRDPECGA